MINFCIYIIAIWEEYHGYRDYSPHLLYRLKMEHLL